MVHAVRVPLANASLTDCVFEVERATTLEEVNALSENSRRRGIKRHFMLRRAAISV